MTKAFIDENFTDLNVVPMEQRNVWTGKPVYHFGFDKYNDQLSHFAGAVWWSSSVYRQEGKGATK